MPELAEARVSQHTIIGVVGDVIVLHQKYDPDQLWFEFMRGTIMRESPNDYYREKKGPHEPHTVRRLAARPAYVPPACKHLYSYIGFPEQMLLPFREGRLTSDAEWNRVKAFWDRDDCGKHYRLIGPTWAVKSGVFHEWLDENVAGRYYRENISIVFERYADFLFAKLRWYNAVQPVEDDAA